MSVPQDLFYAKTHEWVSLNDGVATVGITDFAQSQLSDLTFVELPEVGTEFSAGDEAAVVESVKAAADVYRGLLKGWPADMEMRSGLGWSEAAINLVRTT